MMIPVVKVMVVLIVMEAILGIIKIVKKIIAMLNLITVSILVENKNVQEMLALMMEIGW